MTRDVPTFAEAKAKAKALRQRLADEGTKIGHSQALEHLAHEYGFRDWNTFHAAIDSHRPDGWEVGERVTGKYLSQPFSARVLSSQRLPHGWFRLILDFDEPVDVVQFESFSNLRKRVLVEVGPRGHSKEQTSDGVLHVQLDL